MAEILIIGGGVAGLSAGIRAQLGGAHATVIEKHSTPGGNLTGWDRGGYHIDNCIHWLTGTNPVTAMYRRWEELGALGSVGVYQPETLYTYTEGGRSVSLSRDLNTLERDMLAASECDDREIKKLIRAVKAATALSGIDAKDNSISSSAAEIALRAPALLPYLNKSAGELAERFNSPLLRGFLRSLTGDDFGAVALIFVFATFTSGNGGLPMGASREMARRMASRFTDLGGKLRTGVGAKRINTEDGRVIGVTLDDGSELDANYVILACEPACAFGKLTDASLMPRQLQERYRDPSLRRFSAFHCAFAVDGEELPFSGDLICGLPHDLKREFGTDHLVLREFTHEPGFSPEGHGLMQAICFCAEDRSKDFIAMSRDREGYRQLKAALGERMMETAEELCPELSGRLEVIDVWTPATYRRFTGSPTGSFMAFSLPKGRLPATVGSRVKGVENLYLATQWQSLPGGLPTAANAGWNTAEKVLKAQKRAERRAGAEAGFVSEELGVKLTSRSAS